MVLGGGMDASEHNCVSHNLKETADGEDTGSQKCMSFISS